MKVKLYFDNFSLKKQDVVNNLISSLGQFKFGKYLEVTTVEENADVIIDIKHLESKDQVAFSLPTIARSINEIFRDKMPRLQRGQKKIRRNKK